MFERMRALLPWEKKGALATPSPELLALFGVMASASGAAVTPDTAMRCGPFAGCVKIISESAAQLPLHMYERGADGAKERATDHPLEAVLSGMANPWTSSFEFIRDMTAALAAHGKAAAYIGRSGDKVVELIQFPSSAVSVSTDPVTMEPRYSVTMSDGTQKIYRWDEILYLGSMGITPNCPLSAVHQAREAIGLALAMEQHAAKLFARGARPSGILKAKASFKNPETVKRIKASMDAAHSAESAGGTMVLEEGMEWESLTFNSVDLQFLELRKLQVIEISRFFRVPLHMLGDLTQATFSNVENMGAEFVTLTLMPWLKLWEGAIARSLLKPAERAKYYAEFMTDDLMRGDTTARFNAYGVAITNGILNPNEARAMENRPPYEGGDEYRRPMNTESPGGDNRNGKQPPPQLPAPKPRIVA